MRKRSAFASALAGKVRLCWRENYGSLPNTHMSLCDGIPHGRAINKCSYCDFILRFSPETAAEGNLWRENRLLVDGLWEARSRWIPFDAVTVITRKRAFKDGKSVLM